MARNALGRGLGALIRDVDATTSPASPTTVTSPAAAAVAPAFAVAGGPLLLDIDLLDPSPYQPRTRFAESALEELAQSIRSSGIIQPLVVRRIGARYQLIAGERRWRAAQMAGLTEIPSVIRDVPDEDAVAMALIENIQRENLNPLEEARALLRLIEEFGLTHQAAAEAVGRSRAAVSNLVRLMELTDEVKEMLEHRQIEMGHARALLGLATRRQQIEVATLVAKKSLSVRDTESLVRRIINPKTAESQSAAAAPDPDIHRLETEIAEKLGAKVAFQHAASGKGKLIVSYNSLDELEGILAHIQ